MTDQQIATFEQELRKMQPSALSDQLLNDAELECLAGELAAVEPQRVRQGLTDELLDQITGAELSTIQPAQLRAEFLDTLSLIPEEAEIAELSVAPISAELLNTLTSAVESIEQEVVEEKVILFPAQEQEAKPRSHWQWYASAAAVAVMGIFLGFKGLPGDNMLPSFVQNSQTSVPSIGHNFNPQPISAEPAGELLNVSTNSTLLKASDQGLVTHKTDGETLYRAMKVVSLETATLINEHGKTVKFQRPVERLVFVPAEVE